MGLSSLLYALLLALLLPPPSSFIKILAQHLPPKRVPICPMTTYFRGILPMASLTSFLSSAPGEDTACCALWLPTIRPRDYTGIPPFWPWREWSFFVPPTHNRLCVTKNKTNKQEGLSAWWRITGPDLLIAGLDLYHITAVIHWNRSIDTLLLYPLPVFPFHSSAFQLKTKQSKAKITQTPNLLCSLSSGGQGYTVFVVSGDFSFIERALLAGVLCPVQVEPVHCMPVRADLRDQASNSGFDERRRVSGTWKVDSAHSSEVQPLDLPLQLEGQTQRVHGGSTIVAGGDISKKWHLLLGQSIQDWHPRTLGLSQSACLKPASFAS